MQAWQLSEYGEPRSVLKLCDVELPAPGPGEIKLQVQAAALGLPDVMMCRGTYEYRPEFPFTPGQEVVGRVVAAGEGVSARVGDRLMAITAFYDGYGGFAEQAMTTGGMAYPVPADMPDVHAAAFGIPFQTAWAALVIRGALREGETLLVHGAAGGSGSAAVQLGRALGARVIAVAGGAERAQACRDYGAEAVIDHGSVDFVDQVQALTQGAGVDVIFDPVGGETCNRSVDCLASGGRLLLIGFACGDPGLPDSRKVLLANASVLGVFVGAYAAQDRQHIHQSLLDFYSDGRIVPLVGAELGFFDIPAGLEELAARRSAGKLVARITG
ncbi:MAG: NADPH:quinone oxidoreductase family protein [Halieaceae bacterium]